MGKWQQSNWIGCEKFKLFCISYITLHKHIYDLVITTYKMITYRSERSTMSGTSRNRNLVVIKVLCPVLVDARTTGPERRTHSNMASHPNYLFRFYLLKHIFTDTFLSTTLLFLTTEHWTLYFFRCALKHWFGWIKKVGLWRFYFLYFKLEIYGT